MRLREEFVQYSAATHTYSGYVETQAWHDFCQHTFPLYSGWIMVSGVLQRYFNPPNAHWADVPGTSYTYYTTINDWHQSYYPGGLTSGGVLYRFVSGHGVLLPAGYKQTILLSTEQWG